MPHRRPGLQGMHDEAGDTRRRRPRLVAECAQLRSVQARSMRLGKIAVPPVARSRRTRSPQARQQILPDQKIVVSIPGLNIDK